MQIVGKDISGRGFAKTGELGTVCSCAPQKNILQVLRQRQLHDDNQSLSQIIYMPVHLP